MAVIDPADVLVDVLLYLPTSNVFSDAQLTSMIEFVIANQIPEDDTEYQPEATCKSLRNAAIANQSRFSVDQAGKKREKVGVVEVEYFDGTSKKVWESFLDNLPNICSLLLGYTGFLTSNMMSIAPGEKFIVNPCTVDDLCDPDQSGTIYGEEWCSTTSSLVDDDPFQ